jgi:hypothetical protein
MGGGLGVNGRDFGLGLEVDGAATAVGVVEG